MNARAKKMTYLNELERRTFSVWHPQIKVDGKWCFIQDESTRTKMVESRDEESAMLDALNALKSIDTTESA